MSWTDEKVQKLRELWSKGHTASEIAGMLGDTTRNAVIGKAHRLNLEERAPSKSKSNTEKRDPAKSQPKLRGSASRKSKFKSILLDKNFAISEILDLEQTKLDKFDKKLSKVNSSNSESKNNRKLK